MHTPPPSPVDLSFLYQLKSDGKTSGDFIDRLSQDSVPITISACVDSRILANFACFPGVLMEWQFIIKTMSGRLHYPSKPDFAFITYNCVLSGEEANIYCDCLWLDPIWFKPTIYPI
jgi:hypothetical protein